MLEESAALNLQGDTITWGFVDPIDSGATILDLAIANAQSALCKLQHSEGYWVFELEADCTIPAEYIAMMHFVGEIDELLQAKIANFLRARQNEDGGYALFTGGPGDISSTTKVYYALKLAGDSPQRSHMKKARQFILAHGGAAKCNVFTRILLAMFEQVPWRAVPYIPVEIMLLPQWFPFHLNKVSYWSRTVMVPLFVLCSLKARAANPRKIDIRELFVTDPDLEQHYFPKRGLLNKVFLSLDFLGRSLDPWIPGRMREKALREAKNWFTERLNGEDGLGGIFPAMVGAYEALLLLGIPKDHPDVVTAKKALQKLLVVNDRDAYCQPCLSPVWDTGLAILALQEADPVRNDRAIQRGLDWLISKQLGDEPGDWRIARPDYEGGGGWAFEFENPYYPDVDDSAVVAFAITQTPGARFRESAEKAARWIQVMQSKNGGFGAFDVDNTHYYLNEIPFADHGALLDPPTADVSARCAMFLCRMLDRHPEYQGTVDRCIEYLRAEQENDGSWFGRWGTNYIYGTWSVLVALEQVGIPRDDPMVRKAAGWLKSKQNADGGWGEDNLSYHDPAFRGSNAFSTAFQSAWAILGLIAAGESGSFEVEAGVDYLLNNQGVDGFWEDECFTAPGFPRVFYLKYHGYSKFFPLWALARYRSVKRLP
ncbi:MAG: squalene--hopene cyclase [Methylococcaceae bacterium]|nr:squalene--hopene cyclase [Methylococcaceae bacterium]